MSTEESGDKPCILSFYPLDVLWFQQTTPNLPVSYSCPEWLDVRVKEKNGLWTVDTVDTPLFGGAYKIKMASHCVVPSCFALASSNRSTLTCGIVRTSQWELRPSEGTE